MHYVVLGSGKNECEIDLVKASIIELKRQPSQVFRFGDVENFVDAITGHQSAVICIGVDAEDSLWKAYYWEVAFDQQKVTYESKGDALLPYGSLAVLALDDEYSLPVYLDFRQSEARRWLTLSHKISSLCKKIDRIDDENEFSDAGRFKYMSADELEKILPDMEHAFLELTEKPEIEV